MKLTPRSLPSMKGETIIGRDTFDGHAVIVAQVHDGALAERLLDGGDGALQGLDATFLCAGRVLRGAGFVIRCSSCVLLWSEIECVIIIILYA